MKATLIFILLFVASHSYASEDWCRQSATPTQHAIQEQFVKAIQDKDFALIQSLFAHESIDLSYKTMDRFCMTPLFYAIDSDDVNIVDLLIRNGANVNEVIKSHQDDRSKEDTFYPVTYAAKAGGFNTLVIERILTEVSLDPNVSGSLKETALHLAIKSDRYSIAEKLVNDTRVRVDTKSDSDAFPLMEMLKRWWYRPRSVVYSLSLLQSLVDKAGPSINWTERWASHPDMFSIALDDRDPPGITGNF